MSASRGFGSPSVRRFAPRSKLGRIAPIFAGLLVLLGLLGAVPAPAAPGIPAPPDRRVTDRVGVLSPATHASLERRLAAYEEQSGRQIIVWIDRSSGERSIEEFAVEAFEAWKIGREALDDGLAIFVMVEDREIRIEVGYGLEAVVTDLMAAKVIRETMIPAIERGDWDQAVVGGIEAVVEMADPTTTQNGVESPTQPGWDIAKIVVAVIAGIALLVLFITKPGLALFLLFFLLGRGGGGGGGGGGFSGGGGRSGGGGASGRW